MAPGVGDERVVRDVPVHPALGGHPGHRTAMIADRHRRCPAGPGGDPGPRRDVLGQRLGEHLPLTLRYPATPFPFVPQHWSIRSDPVSYTHLRAHETDSYLVCRLLLEKKKN